ncbi:MAG: BREX-3 system P-loop-containing protein BrxF [Hahellaceae bacterium]|nr:BREX-3 system P-loop-containing protein BrxF [Hahellaceae bacterium]MCP5210027.1 BREX-3 system P-loop-containing protein BrxF [Hahellaceae bacterium]
MDLGEAVKRAANYRNQLILLCGDQKACLRQLEDYATSAELSIRNLNLELSAVLLEEPVQDRKRTSVLHTEDWLRKLEGNTLLLSHIEFLFDSALGMDPIKVLLNSSKHKVIVAIWPGTHTADALSYATPGHHEYKQYKSTDLGETILLPISAE